MSKRDREDMENEDEVLKLSNEDISNIVKEINESNLTVKEKDIFYRKKYPDFSEKCPFMFKMSCEPNFDIKTFNYMLNMRQKILDNKMTTEAASVEIGQKFFDKYMKK
jgi:hypothetical protein